MSVKVFWGGQTVILGSFNCDIGFVFTVVLIGFSSHPANDSKIKNPAIMLANKTTTIQKSREAYFLLLEIWLSPSIETDSRKFFTPSMSKWLLFSCDQPSGKETTDNLTQNNTATSALHYVSKAGGGKPNHISHTSIPVQCHAIFLNIILDI